MEKQKMDGMEKVAGGGPTPNRGEATVFRFGSQAQRIATQEALNQIGFGSMECITPIPCDENGPIMSGDEEYIFKSGDGRYWK